MSVKAKAAAEQFLVTGITLKTNDNGKPFGKGLSVLVTLRDGRKFEVISEWGALPDITIYHHVTAAGIEESMERNLK